ncbi:MAG: aminotransferase class I/II-fold pyridoxal phosphate-dependent enzyme [Acutalibacteraceae bacterium]|nr:aminotransferase class I/II-fold pyridoxal phosphate-dependent enzyme [Acutalibacteraceae bacterium]
MNYNDILNKNVTGIKPSGIRKFFDIAEQMDDVISLGVGEPDFATPWHIRNAGIKALENKKTRYTSNHGLLELRQEICNYMKRKFELEYSVNDVLVTVGGSEAIDAAVRSIVSSGDEVIIPQPSFVCYEPITVLAGGVPVILETKAENEFRITPKELKEKITDKTKLLVLPYPCNPTGGIMERQDLEAIAQIIIDNNIIVLSDEIYSELTYGIKHTSIAQIEGMQERTVIINGFSKTYSMTGWRLGYACGPEPIIEQMTKIHQFAIMSAPTVSQYAAIDALKNGDIDIKKMLVQYDQRRRYIVSEFNKIGLDCFDPKGAFYVFPSIKKSGLSSDEFCEQLLYSKKVALVPGTAFGECGEGFIRASYCYSVTHIKEAIKRIGEFLKELGV